MARRPALPLDLDDDSPVYDRRGNLVDDDYVAKALVDVERTLGRPSLTGHRRKSPQVVTRVTPALRAKAEGIARDRGVSLSVVVREALQEYVDRAIAAYYEGEPPSKRANRAS